MYIPIYNIRFIHIMYSATFIHLNIYLYYILCIIKYIYSIYYITYITLPNIYSAIFINIHYIEQHVTLAYIIPTISIYFIYISKICDIYIISRVFI